jgi:hypothetical protein
MLNARALLDKIKKWNASEDHRSVGYTSVPSWRPWPDFWRFASAVSADNVANGSD